MTSSAVTDLLLERARAWLADDPDEITRAELAQVIADVEGGADPADLADAVRRHPRVRDRGTPRRGRRRVRTG